MRILRFWWHFLFDWRIKARYVNKMERQVKFYPTVPKEFLPPLLTKYGIRQCWIWYYDGHYCETWERRRLVNTVIDNQVTPTMPFHAL